MPSVLLVDDKPERLLTYVAILEQLPVTLVETASGEEALELVRQKEFAAILLDVKMPGLNGFETAAKIRRLPKGVQTPIIFVTGIHVSDLDRLRGYEVGASDYVYVPVVPEILRAKIRVLVQLHEQRLELSRLNEQLIEANIKLARAHEKLKVDNTRELTRLNETLALANGQLQSEIGERKLAEQRLLEAARRKDEFISILAHELRNPLTAMHSGIELMRLPSLPKVKQTWAQGLVERQLNNLVRIIDDLLDVSRVTNGRVQLKKELVDLRSVITHALDTSKAQIEERAHEVDVQLPDEPLYVDGDTVRLGQIFGNLLGNASKYMNPGGRIEISADIFGDDPGRVAIRVLDHGTGLREDMLEHIFELFARVEPEERRVAGGLGIGLALVRKLVELHGGTVMAASAGPGLGSHFTVELPRVHASPVSAAVEPRQELSYRPRLLIIDDNVDAAQAMARLFETLSSCTVYLAHDGISGVAAAREHRPDLIFLDIGLPDIDGYEVAHRLRVFDETKSIPVVAVTGFGRDFDRGSAREAGFADFLTKPVAYLDLERVLAEFTSANAPDRPDSLATA